MPSKQVEDVYNAQRAAGKIDSRGRPTANKYQCSRCNGTGDEPEATGRNVSVLAELQKHLDDVSVPRDQHDAMSEAANLIEKLLDVIKRHREDRSYVVGFSDGFDAAISQMEPAFVNANKERDDG